MENEKLVEAIPMEDWALRVEKNEFNVIVKGEELQRINSQFRLGNSENSVALSTVLLL